MNINKRSYGEGWVLCPSKSFPGKFYYFNTLGGDTVWSLSDVEKRISIKNGIQRVMDKWHTYPEPETPPTEECLHSTQNWQYRRPECLQSSYRGNNQDGPSFGHAMFPKYAPNAIEPNVPNYVWAPVSMPSVYSIKPSRLHIDNGPHDWEMKRNLMLQSPNEDQSRHFLKPQRKNYHENLIKVNDPSHLQNLHVRQLFDVKPSNFQNSIEKQAHDSLSNVNKSGNFQRCQQKVCNENLFNIKKPNIFHKIVENNVFRVSEPTFRKVHEKPYHEIASNTKPGSSQNQSHMNLFHINKSNYFPKPQEKYENIVKKNFANTTTPIKSKWGFDSQTQNQQSNVYEQQINNDQQIFERQNCQSQGNTAIKEPIINRIWTRPVPKTLKTNDNFLGSRSADGLRSKNSACNDDMPIRVQTQQGNVGSKPKRTVTINDMTRFGKSNLCPEEQFQLGPQKKFQDMGQKIQAENYVSELNENYEDFDDSACFDMLQSDQSPQKGIKNAKRIPISYENPNDSACFEMSDSSPQKRFQPETSAQKRIQTESYVVSRCYKNQAAPFEIDLNPRKRASITASSMAVEEKLDGTDLRHILLAKRKKVDSDETQKKGKKIKTSYSNYQEKDKDLSPKKRVTFNFGVEDQETRTMLDDDQSHMTDTMTEDLGMNTLRNLAKPDSNTDHWYIVVHTDVLIEDFEFIEKFVMSDEKCILLIPVRVRVAVDLLCVGNCLGRRRVLAARRLARRLASPPPHIAVQLCEEDTKMSVNDSILNCCFQALDENYHVVLITNDTEMCSEAKSMDLHSFTLQEIKEHAAAAEKPKLTFEFRKITTENHSKENSRSLVEVIENQLPKLSLDYKRKAASNKQEKFLVQASNDCDSSAANTKKIPVNVFRKRMFDGVSDKNKDNPSLFFRNNDCNMTEQPLRTEKGAIYAKILTDRDENRNFTKFPSRNITQTNGNDSLEYESSLQYKESPATTSDINCRVQKLNLEETSRTRDQWPKTNQKAENRPQTMEVNLNAISNTSNKTNSALKLCTINRYTIDEHLKGFIVKHSMAEGMIKTRMDEWVCSFTQIMEETLSDVIQNHSPALTNKLPPPWILPEAAECVREVYGDHTPVRITVERLSALLFEHSCKKGYLKLSMAPNDFMKIIGCGSILIQCLKTILPNAASLSDAEESLNKLLQAISEPSCDPVLPQWIHAPVLASCELSDPVAGERRNFMKKSSDIIAYLEKHFPACQALNDDKLQETTVVQTFGCKLNMLKLNNNKSFILKRPVDAKGQTDQCDGVDDNLNQTGLEDGKKNAGTFIIKSPELCDNVKENALIEKDTGAKLLRKLSLKNSGLNTTKFKEIDVELREKNDKELTAMIDQMIVGKTFPNSGVNKIKENNENIKPISKRPVIVRKFDTSNFAIKQSLQQKSKDYIKEFDFNSPLNNNGFKQNEKEDDEPKLIRKIDAFELKKYNKKVNENIVAVDYSVLDYEEDDFTSQKTLTSRNNDRECNINDETNQVADNENNHSYVQNKDNSVRNNVKYVQNNDDYVQNNDECLQNNDNYVQNNDDDLQNSNNSYAEGSNGTTNDSGVETESQQALSLAKTFLAEFSRTFKIVYRFLKYGIEELRKGVQDNTRGDFHEKASLTHTHVAVIIDILKSIIKRESGRGPTLQDLLIRAGANVANDKRMTRYRQVVTKCLEQAEMLESALRVFIGATDDRDASHCATSAVGSSGNIQYYNIFE